MIDDSLPSRPDAERSLLGAILIDGALLSRVTAVLTPEDLAVEADRVIFTAMLSLADKSEGIDLITVQAELDRGGQLERAGGAAYVAGLLDLVPDVEHVADYARLVRDAARRRAVILRSRQTIREAKDAPDVATVIEGAQRDLGALAVPNETKNSGVFDVTGILGRSSTNGPRFMTGIDALDERLSPKHDPSKHGLPLGRRVGIVAPPHAGKSVTADQLTVAALRAGLRVGMLVTDEPREDVAERIGQGLGFRHAELNADYPETLARLREVEELFRLVVLPDEDVGPVTIEQAGEILFGVPASGYVLIVDSIHTSRSSTENENDATRVGIEKRLDALKTLRNRGALVIFTAEGNRASYASADPAQRATAMSSGAESRAIEFGADVLLVLSRDGDDFHVEIPKNRVGRKRESFTMRLHAGSASFRSVTEETVKMENAGRRAEGLLGLEYRIVELLEGLPEGLSQRGIERERLGQRDDVREALRSAVEKGKVHRVAFPRGSGFLFKLGPDPSGARGAPEVRERCAGAPAGTGVGGARADYKEARTTPPRQAEITFEEKENSAHPVTVSPEPEAFSQPAEAAPDDDAPEPAAPPPVPAPAPPTRPADEYMDWARRKLLTDLDKEEDAWPLPW